MARYKIWANTEAGVLVVENARSPDIPLTDPFEPIPQQLPVHHLSDFTFMVWEAACHGDQGRMKSLQWVIHDHITELVTQRVVQAALEVTNQQKRFWPGVSFSTSEQPGIALVGSPNGWGVAFMLSQHHTLGPMTIDKVHVFMNDRRQWNLAFHIGWLERALTD